MQVTSLKSKDHLDKLLKRTDSISHDAKQNICTLDVRTLIPFIHKTVHVDVTEISRFYSSAEQILRSYTAIKLTKKPGTFEPQLVRDALNTTINCGDRLFWLTDSGIIWHDEITGIKLLDDYSPKHVSVSLKDGSLQHVSYRVISANHPKVAQCMLDIDDLVLTEAETLAIINVSNLFAGQNLEPVFIEHPSFLIKNLLSVDKPTEDCATICYVIKTDNNDFRYCQSNIDAMELAFPRITHALVASKVAPNFESSTRAALLRSWWLKLPDNQNKPVLFSVYSQSFMTRLVTMHLREYEYESLHRGHAYVHNWEDLSECQSSPDSDTIIFSFSNNGDNNKLQEVQCWLKVDNEQLTHLGIDKLIDVINSLGLPAKDAAEFIKASYTTKELDNAVALPNDISITDITKL